MALADYLTPINHDYEEHIHGCNPCDVCSYPIGDCPWLHDGKPVKGWTAKRSYLSAVNGGHRIKTYRIIACPLYQPPKSRRVSIPATGQ